nr:hypothetical protein CFP56_75617 [Quercus suber]
MPCHPLFLPYPVWTEAHRREAHQKKDSKPPPKSPQGNPKARLEKKTPNLSSWCQKELYWPYLMSPMKPRRETHRKKDHLPSPMPSPVHNSSRFGSPSSPPSPKLHVALCWPSLVAPRQDQHQPL